jgi:lipopolysaccharide transport system ATP-binding protein
MSNPIIKVNHLGKKYIIGHQQQDRNQTFRDAIVAASKSLMMPFRGAKRNQLNPAQEEFWALRDVSFEVRPGDRLGIVGRNGAGKSTLLKVLSRITEPTQGSIKIKGRIASLLEVGTGFHPELSGRENIYLNGAILGMSKSEIQRKFDEIVAFAEIEKFLDTPVKRYSSGMYVRLAFAVAAHLEPEILIVDEVLAVGDAQFQKKCLGKMEDVGKEGRTILFVSHNMATVKQLCTRAILLQSGTIVDDGSPAQVISRYMQNTIQGSVSGNGKVYKHIQGDRRAEITKISLNESDGQEAIVSIFEPLQLTIDYQIKHPIDEFECFVLVHTIEDGEVQASLFQRDSGTTVTPSAATGQLTLKFQNQFLPGRYVLSAGIFDKNRHFVDWVEYAETFYVETAFSNGQRYDDRLGKLSLQGSWYAD